MSILVNKNSKILVQGFTGTTFPVKALPTWLIPIALILPLTYGLDAVRGLLLRTATLLPLYVETHGRPYSFE